MTDHVVWEQLAAGFALDALEPDEVAELQAHVAGCADCRRVLDEHRAVAAQLAALAEPMADEPTAPRWSAVRAGIIRTTDSDPPVEQPATVVPFRARQQPRVLAAAAAAVLVAGAGIAVWQVDRGGASSSATSAIAACQHDAGCQVAQLRTSSGSTVAAVLVRGHAVEFVNIDASGGVGHELALWQLPRSGRPVLLAQFATSKRWRTTLRLPLTQTAGFALSHEPAGVVATQPSVVVATS